MTDKTDFGYIRADLNDYISELDNLMGNIRVLRDDCPVPLLEQAEELLDMGVAEIGEALRTLRQAEVRLPLGKENKKL